MIRSSRNVRPAQCGKLFSEPQISYSDNCVLKKKFRWVFFFPPSLQPTQPFTTSQLAREEAPLNSSRSAKHKLFIFPPRIVLTAPLNVLDGVEAVNVVKRDLLSPHFKKKKKLFFRPSCGGKGASQPGGVSAQIPYQSLHLWHSHGLIIKSASVFWFCAFVYLFFFFFFPVDISFSPERLPLHLLPPAVWQR